MRENPSLLQNFVSQLRWVRGKVLPEDTKRYFLYFHLKKALEIQSATYFSRAFHIFRTPLEIDDDTPLAERRFYFWILSVEPTAYQLRRQRKLAAHFARQPLISIITPVARPRGHAFGEMLQSVINQSYPNWELCIADNGPEDDQIKKKITALSDPRIKYLKLSADLSLAEVINQAARMARGEFTGFLDQGDSLAPFALYETVKVLNEKPHLDLLYSDSDYFETFSKKRFAPFFKPDFSIDFLRGINYLSHFIVVRKTLGDRIGWMRNGFDGAQDYDFILRAVERSQQVSHIPQILYHRGFFLADEAENPRHFISSIKALEEHYERQQIAARVFLHANELTYRTRYVLRETPLVSIIIPNRDEPKVLKRCIESILGLSTYPHIEFIIVENSSVLDETKDLYKHLKAAPNIHVVVWRAPFNYSLVNNFGAEYAKGKVLLFLNNDVEVISPGWLEEMLVYALRPDVGCVGAKLYYPAESTGQKTIQHAGVVVGLFRGAGHSHKHYPGDSPGYFGRLQAVQEYSAVTAACMMIQKDRFTRIRGFDPLFEIEFGDVDLCLRVIEAGYKVIFTPFAELYHYESKTRGRSFNTVKKYARHQREIALLRHRWKTYTDGGDPFYNPNLTVLREDFSVAP